MLKRQLNKILARDPKLIKSFDRFHIHPLVQKYSYIPR